MKFSKKIILAEKDPKKFSAPITKPDMPELVTPFDDLLLDEYGRTISDVATWERKRSKILERFKETLGEFPEQKASLAPEYLSEHDCQTYVRKELRYHVHEEEYAHAYLCIPKQGEKPFPAVLCLHGTNDFGREQTMGLTGNRTKAFGKDLAERGFVTFCADHFVAGKRMPVEGSFVTKRFYERFPNWSAVGKAVWEGAIAVDLLESLPEVDLRRIGCMGHSLGGHGAVFFTICDERIKCVVVNCGTGNFRCNPKRTNWSRDGWYIYFPKLRPLFLQGKPAPFDFHELLGSIAPRPFLDISTLREPSWDGNQHLPGMFLRVHEVYELYGAGERFAHYMHNCGHGMFHHSMSLAYAWLETWLTEKSAGESEK